MTTFSVVIPSYGRPENLACCLTGLEAQTVRFDEVIVVVRRHDEPTKQVATQSPLNPTVVIVDEPGVLAAMARGFEQSHGDWVAFTDDDAVASPTWLERITELAEGEGVVGVGGRDVIVDHGVERPTTLTTTVGVMGRFGRFVGNHHRGTGAPRRVAMLKGVNCAYDASVLGIPTGLYGSGAQAHFEVAIGLDLERRGLLLYDPSLVVRHSPADRLDADQRQLPSRRSIADVASNAVLACGVRSTTFACGRAIASLMLGDASVPGIGRVLIGIANSDIRRRFLPSIVGTLRGLLRVLSGRPVTFLRR